MIPGEPDGTGLTDDEPPRPGEVLDERGLIDFVRSSFDHPWRSSDGTFIVHCTPCLAHDPNLWRAAVAVRDGMSVFIDHVHPPRPRLT